MENFKISELEILYESQPKIKLEHIGKGLNVVFGSNESGKSRIKEFIEWMIFAQSPQFTSLSPQAKKSSFQSVNQILKGSMTVQNNLDSATLTQQMSGNTAVASLGTTNIAIDDLVHLLSDDLSLDHFRNVFSLNLDALSREQSNQLLSEDKTAEVFLSAAQTGSGVSLSALVSDLKEKKEDLFSESGNATKRQINRLLKEIGDIDRDIRQIRREQQTSLSFTSDIESLQHEHKDLKVKLSKITEELANLLLTKNYAQPYEQYLKLALSDSAEINSDLIGEIVNIKELLSQCEHHEGDEKLLNQLLIEKSEIQDSLDQNRENLERTLDPNKVSDELNSHSFKTELELEKQDSAQYIQSLARAQEAFDKDNDELVRLTSRVDELSKQIETIEENNKPIESTEKIDILERPKNKSRQTLIWSSALTTGIIFSAISVITSQLIGVISGLILIAVGISIKIMKSGDIPASKPLEATTIESIEVSNISREIDGLYSQIKHRETQIEKHVQTLKDLERTRTSAKQSFTKI